jgi:hypothetical protein
LGGDSKLRRYQNNRAADRDSARQAEVRNCNSVPYSSDMRRRGVFRWIQREILRRSYLAKIAKLHSDDALSEAEFEALKQKLISDTHISPRTDGRREKRKRDSFKSSGGIFSNIARGSWNCGSFFDIHPSQSVWYRPSSLPSGEADDSPRVKGAQYSENRRLG